ncbi:right-handed parallel beta-helix repeat-containing protein [Salinithrix halophila]|uniref:Right-handed parallel beta-helix repeat-containing protein n=1 Tax=Salinithrix halophila TaxID=1485204 RepID=A0ABV8JAH3_9BACL
MTRFDVTDFGAVADGKSDDAPAIQRALDAARDAGGGTVAVPGGTYAVYQTLRIYSLTTMVLEKNALIRRAAPTNAMIINGTNGKGGYDGSENIEINGGTWDARMNLNEVKCTVIAIGHARDIKIRDVRVLDVRDWHGIELNGVDHAEVSGCYFHGFTLTRRWSEAIQLDLMLSPAAFPWFGPYDYTHCRNILIQGCTFTGGWYRGVGSHAKADGVYHAYIRIANNHFDSLTGEGVEAYRYRHVSIDGNTFNRVETGIRLLDCAYCTITGNNMRYPAKDGIVLIGSAYNAITGNIIRGAGGTGVDILEQSSQNNVSGNIFTGIAGPVVRECGKQGNTMTGNIGK